MAKSEDEVVVRLRLADVRRFIEDVKSGRKSIEDLDKTVAKAGRTARIEAGPSGGLGALSGVMRGVVTWGARGTAVLATAGAGVAAYAVKSAASLEQVTMSFTTMLHSSKAAKNMVADLQSFAQTTPFELAGVEATTQKLLAFGFAAKNVRPMLTSIGNAASGLGIGQPGMDSVAIALGQMKMKGRVQGDELLQLAEHGINAYSYLEKALGLSGPQLQKAVTAGKVSADKAIPIILDGMNKQFRGLMEKQSHTLGGIWSNFHDAMEQGLVRLANPALPTLKRWLSEATNFLGDSKSRTGHVHEGFLSRAGRFAPYLAGNIVAGRSSFAAYNIGAVIGTHKFDPAIEKAVTVAHNLGVIVAKVLVPAAKDLGIVLGPVVVALEHLDTITGFVVDHSDAFHTGLVILVGAVVGYRVAVFGINKALAIHAGVSKMILVLKGEEVAATNAQKVAWYGYRGAVLAGKGALAAVKGLNMAAWWLAQRGALLAVKTAQLGVNAAQRIWIEMKFWGVIGKAGAAWALAKVKLVAYRAMMLAVRLATLAWTGAQWLLNVAMTANPIGLIIVGIAALIAIVVIAYMKVGWFRNGVNAAARFIVAAWGKVLDFFKAAPGKIASFGKGMWNGIIDGFKAAVNWIIGKWNWLADHMPSINIPGVGEVGGLPKIPALATGGTAVQAGTALVGERGPEVISMPRGASVIPLPRARDFGGDGEIQRVTVVQIEGREVARAVHRYQDDRMARR